jgi:hypothetical protein
MRYKNDYFKRETPLFTAASNIAFGIRSMSLGSKGFGMK